MFGGGGDGDSFARMRMMASPLLSPPLARGEERGTAAQPQWGREETRDFITIRAELERDFTEAKRNKSLWEVVSVKMKERGYSRTPDQCKCKWKNLVIRYKGKEASDPENGRQCPFFEELHTVFTERTKHMQRLLLESEVSSGQAKKKVKRVNESRFSDEFSENEDEDEVETDEARPAKSNPPKRKAGKSTLNKSSRVITSTNSGSSGIEELLKEFLHQQQRMEMQWMETMEKHARERELFAQEWRQTMENIERERLIAEQAWREREEQRRVREERRAERRDALLTTLLNKLLHESDPSSEVKEY